MQPQLALVGFYSAEQQVFTTTVRNADIILRDNPTHNDLAYANRVWVVNSRAYEAFIPLLDAYRGDHGEKNMPSVVLWTTSASSLPDVPRFELCPYFSCILRWDEARDREEMVNISQCAEYLHWHERLVGDMTDYDERRNSVHDPVTVWYNPLVARDIGHLLTCDLCRQRVVKNHGFANILNRLT